MSNTFLILDPHLQIAEASDAYLRATLLWNGDIFGSHIFDVFPDNPQDDAADGVNNLGASLHQVLHSGQPHRMDVQRYDVRDFVAGSEAWVEKHWAPLNSPVYGGDSHEVTHIIHEVRDVTPAVALLQRIEQQAQTIEHALATLDTLSDELQQQERQYAQLREMVAALLRGEASADTFETIQTRYNPADGRRYYNTANRAPVSGIYQLFHRRQCGWPVHERLLQEGQRFPRCAYCRDDVLYRLKCSTAKVEG